MLCVASLLQARAVGGQVRLTVAVSTDVHPTVQLDLDVAPGTAAAVMQTAVRNAIRAVLLDHFAYTVQPGDTLVMLGGALA